MRTTVTVCDDDCVCPGNEGLRGGDRSLSQFGRTDNKCEGVQFPRSRAARALTHLPLSLRRPPAPRPPPPARRSPLHERNRLNPFLLASAHVRGSDGWHKAASDVTCGFSNVRMLPLRPYSFQPQSRSLMRHCSCTTLSAALLAASALTITDQIRIT